LWRPSSGISGVIFVTLLFPSGLERDKNFERFRPVLGAAVTNRQKSPAGTKSWEDEQFSGIAAWLSCPLLVWRVYFGNDPFCRRR
jgi:hypothetical protein